MLGLGAVVATTRDSLLEKKHRVIQLGVGFVCLPKADWISRLGAGVESVGRVRFHAKCVSCRCLEGLEPASWERDTSFGKPNAVAAGGCSSAPIGLAATIHHLLAASACGHGQMTRPCCLHRHSQKNGCGGCACGSKRGCCGRCGFPMLTSVGRAKSGCWLGSWCGFVR